MINIGHIIFSRHLDMLKSSLHETILDCLIFGTFIGPSSTIIKRMKKTKRVTVPNHIMFGVPKCQEIIDSKEMLDDGIINTYS